MTEKLRVQRINGKDSPWVERMGGDRREPLKIWEIDAIFRCPLVGGCLTMAEQKHLLKKVGISSGDKNPYEIHEVLVGCCESDNRLSRRLDNLLAKKFGKDAARLMEMDQHTFMAHWNDRFKAGDHHGALWAAAVRGNLDVECRRHIFGMIHMAMHDTLEQRARSMDKTATLERKEIEARQKLKDIAVEKKTLEKHFREMQAENHKLKVRLNAAEKENQKENQRHASPEDDARRIALERRVMELERHVLELEKRAAGLFATVAEQKRHIDLLTGIHPDGSPVQESLTKPGMPPHHSFRTAFSECRPADACDETCPAFDLCRKRVLIVGGIGRMETFYRQLIESRNGLLEYHDGNVRGGVRQLENSLRRADIILCPVNCNSHAACSLVKNLGKKHCKPVHMMSNFSLNAVSKMIVESTSAVSSQN
jgi:hypothetical protein